MALELSTELDSGITGNYWRIGSVVVACTDNPIVTVYMELYLNRAARYNGKIPLITRPVNMNLSQIDPTFDYDFRACVYNSMNTLDGWASAKFLYEFDETYETRPIVNFVSAQCDYNGSVVLPTFTGIDLNDLPLTFQISTQPANGTISENNGVFTYTPNTSWSGSEVAYYTAYNGTEYSKPAKIYLSVPDVVPTASNISATCEVNGSVDLGFNANDPNNLPLTFEIVSQPTNGLISESNGVFTYSPFADYAGPDAAEYRASNGTYTSNTATISITVQ